MDIYNGDLAPAPRGITRESVPLVGELGDHERARTGAVANGGNWPHVDGQWHHPLGVGGDDEGHVVSAIASDVESDVNRVCRVVVDDESRAVEIRGEYDLRYVHYRGGSDHVGAVGTQLL